MCSGLPSFAIFALVRSTHLALARAHVPCCLCVGCPLRPHHCPACSQDACVIVAAQVCPAARTALCPLFRHYTRHPDHGLTRPLDFRGTQNTSRQLASRIQEAPQTFLCRLCLRWAYVRNGLSVCEMYQLFLRHVLSLGLALPLGAACFLHFPTPCACCLHVPTLNSTPW